MIEELPDLPFGLILSEFSHEDRLSMRRVCKKLKSLVDVQVCRNLFVFLDSYHCHFIINKSAFRITNLGFFF